MNKMCLLSLLTVISLNARFHTITSQNSFEDLVNKYPYAVVCFVPSKSDDKTMSKEEKREIRDDFREFKHRLKAASESSTFKHYLPKDVGFLLVDVTARRAEEIDDMFHLDVLPTCLLFRQGKAMLDYGKIFEPISKHSILKFLEKHFQDDFDDLIKEKKEKEKLEREERLARYEAYARYGYPYGYSWGYGPYWGYPGYGYHGYYGLGGCW